MRGPCPGAGWTSYARRRVPNVAATTGWTRGGATPSRPAGTVASSQDILRKILVQVALCCDYPGPGGLELAELPVWSPRCPHLGQPGRVVLGAEISGAAAGQCGHVLGESATGITLTPCSFGVYPCASLWMLTWILSLSGHRSGSKPTCFWMFFLPGPSVTLKEHDLSFPWLKYRSFGLPHKLCAMQKKIVPVTISPFERNWEYNTATALGGPCVCSDATCIPLPLALTFCNCAKGESVPSKGVSDGFRLVSDGFLRFPRGFLRFPMGFLTFVVGFLLFLVGFLRFPMGFLTFVLVSHSCLYGFPGGFLLFPMGFPQVSCGLLWVSSRLFLFPIDEICYSFLFPSGFRRFPMVSHIGFQWSPMGFPVRFLVGFQRFPMSHGCLCGFRRGFLRFPAGFLRFPTVPMPQVCCVMQLSQVCQETSRVVTSHCSQQRHTQRRCKVYGLKQLASFLVSGSYGS